MVASIPPAPRRSVRWRNLRRAQKLCVLGLGLLLLVLGLEGVARLYWWRVKGVTKISPEAIWRTAYTEMADSGIDGVAPYHGDKTFDVLLLGASVLHPCCGDVAARLQRRLGQKLGRPVRVLNLSFPGRTTVESRMKYAHLADRRFDLVLVYHAINDTYVNNCPHGAFRPDYSHVSHIAQMQALERHPEVSWFCLPYTIKYLLPHLGQGWRLTGCHWDLRYGSELRTPPSFEANLEAIATMAENRGDPLMLASFASYVPANYSREAFKAHRLDYGTHYAPVEAWGEPANLIRGLAAHNAAIRRVAARHQTLFVDVAGQMPPGRLYFDDPCHLAPEGCRRFVELIVDALPASMP